VSTDYAVAWLLPLFAGGGLVRLLAGTRQPGQAAFVAGAGWLIGVFLAAAACSWQAEADTQRAFALAAPWLAGFGTLAWLAAGWRWRIAMRRWPSPMPTSVQSRMTGAPRLLWWVMLVLVLVRLALLADEALLRPVFPWDAWSAWAVKPKTWMLLGRADPYVPLEQWLEPPQAAVRTIGAWSYPELLAWIEVWFASAAGGWNEPLVDFAWTGLLAAIALAMYGGARGFGLRPWLSMALAYALVSLPLIDAHVALAGYADLWLAGTLGLATLAWARWMVLRDPGQWLLAVGLALCLPSIKLEGAIWLLVFSAVVVLELLPPRWRRIVVVAAPALLAVGLLRGGFVLPMLGLGFVEVSWERIAIPVVGTFELGWHRVGTSMLASLFELPNWHLLWYALPAFALLRWRVLVRDDCARLLLLQLTLQLGFLFVLFFFTQAGAWAQDYTSASRLLLQVVPGTFVLGMRLWQPLGSDRFDGAPGLSN